MNSDNQTAAADTLANQCPKCCGTGSIIYLGAAPSIVCIDCGGSGRVQTRSDNQTSAESHPEKIPPSQKEANRAVEEAWRRGDIGFRAFDWWLRTMSGV